MKRIVLAFLCAATAAATTGGAAQAADKRSLSQFLSDCNAETPVCRLALHDYFKSAKAQGFICPPASLDIEAAIDRMLAWMRENAAKNPSLDKGNIEDAEWEAVSALWRCRKAKP